MEPPLVGKSVSTKGKTNPAADPRKMRRIIAEDPEWNLETVSPLVDACVKHIVENFNDRPVLNEINPPKYKQQVLNKLPTTIPLKVTGPLITDEGYWERCCRSRWDLCDVSEYDLSWKRMFFERNTQEAIENFVPEKTDSKELVETLRLSAPFVRRLDVRQLLPPPREKLLQVAEDEEEGEEAAVDACNNHLDCGLILKHLYKLEQLQLCYGVRNCGMNFEWSLFEFTKADCQLLSQAVQSTHTLRVLRLHHSKASDERGRMLIAHLLDHPNITELNLSHNSLGDGTGRALGKLLNGRSPKLSILDVSNNSIGVSGGTSIGHALHGNTSLKHLNIRMNRLGDEGVQPILKALMKNANLAVLNISSNNIGEPSAPCLSEMLIANRTLTSLNIACNKLGEAGGKLLQEGMEENKTLVTFDLRLTEISQESEYSINQIVKENEDRNKTR